MIDHKKSVMEDEPHNFGIAANTVQHGVAVLTADASFLNIL